MSFITLNHLGILSPTCLFQDLNLTIRDANRIGLIAGNGGGKTTLLRCISGDIEPTHGTVTLARGLKLGFVEQHVPASLMEVEMSEVVRTALPIAGQADGLWRVDILLDAFETPSELRSKRMNELSGGWQRLALLARMAASEPDVVLLDEPTNHLDLTKIRLLEDWIRQTLKGIPILVSSHDRHFLDACTSHTLFLRPIHSKLYAHPYSRARILLSEDDASEEKLLSRQMKEAERLRNSASELRNIGINSRSDAAQKKSKQLAQRATDLEDSFKPLAKEKSGELRLQSRDSHAKVLLSFDDFVVTTPEGKTLFRTGKVKIFQGDRLVILGANGTGKSRLIHAVQNAFAISKDNFEPGFSNGIDQRIKFSPSAVLGYVDQHMSQLADELSPFDLITSQFRLGDQRSRTLLAGVGFPVDRQKDLLKRFSFGQKARLGMLVLRLTQPNFYLLDEPTNHVDIAGQEKLEAEILDQNATCLFVSHDRSFVKAVATRYFAIENGKLIETDRSIRDI